MVLKINQVESTKKSNSVSKSAHNNNIKGFAKSTYNNSYEIPANPPGKSLIRSRTKILRTRFSGKKINTLDSIFANLQRIQSFKQSKIPHSEPDMTNLMKVIYSNNNMKNSNYNNAAGDSKLINGFLKDQVEDGFEIPNDKENEKYSDNYYFCKSRTGKNKNKLQKPKKIYVDCPIREKPKVIETSNYEEEQSYRRKMTPKEWRAHLTHLEHLAYPKPRSNAVQIDRGKKVPLEQLKSRLEVLATPKIQHSLPSDHSFSAESGKNTISIYTKNIKKQQQKTNQPNRKQSKTEVPTNKNYLEKKNHKVITNPSLERYENRKTMSRIENLAQPKRVNRDVPKQKRFNKQEKRRELRLKRFWRSPKTTSSEDSTGYESPTRIIPFINDPLGVGCSDNNKYHSTKPQQQINSKPTCSLPLLQVWPSQDSPRGEADGSSFIFPAISEDIQCNQQLNSITSSNDAGTSSSDTSHQTTTTISVNNNISNNLSSKRRHSLYCDTLHAGDSGIESVQASPSPNALPCPPGAIVSANASPSTTPTLGSPNLSHVRRKSSALLHPDHARLFALRMQMQQQHALTSPDQTSLEDMTEFNNNGGLPGSGITGVGLCTASSSTTSSLTSIAAVSLGTTPTQRVSDPWLQPQSDREQHSKNHRHNLERRRSSTMTARYSLFDALDLEYALLRAAARGSVGPYSLSESIHKLTFTQSLAFPALARGLATKRRRSNTQSTTRPLNPNESGLNTFAKVITALVLVMVSFLIFLIVYKFVKT